jgi:hypothetical protein
VIGMRNRLDRFRQDAVDVPEGFAEAVKLLEQQRLSSSPWKNHGDGWAVESQRALALLAPFLPQKMTAELVADDPKIRRHSEDFRSVVWWGTSYTFTKSQAACVRILWTAWKEKTPELDGLTVVTQADIAQTRLIDVFRSKGKAHAAWGTMIVSGKSKGAYRLSEGTTITVPKTRRKQSRKTTRKTHR